jgi:hypothetical protein
MDCFKFGFDWIHAKFSLSIFVKMSSIVAHSVLYPSVSHLSLKDLDLTSAGRYCEILGSFSWTVRGGWSLPYTESACCVDLLTTRRLAVQGPAVAGLRNGKMNESWLSGRPLAAGREGGDLFACRWEESGWSQSPLHSVGGSAD